MKEKRNQGSLRELVPGFVREFDQVPDLARGSGLEKLLKQAKKYLIEEGSSEEEAQRFVLTVASQASKNQGVLVQDRLELSPGTLEDLYRMALKLYEAGSYEEATGVFQLLLMLNHFEFNYLFGMAACMQMQGDFFHAATTYVLSATLDPSQVWPHFHAAECYMEIADPISASASLSLAIDVCGDDVKLSPIKERCLLTKTNLLKKIRLLNDAKGEV